MKRAKREQKLHGFESAVARGRAIAKFRQQGYNYFVCYEDKKLRYAVQIAKSTSKWVKEHGKHGTLIEGV